jgi:hypothetical protein
MTLFIVRSEHREFQALHAKLDQVLRLQGEDRQEIIPRSTIGNPRTSRNTARAQRTAMGPD